MAPPKSSLLDPMTQYHDRADSEITGADPICIRIARSHPPLCPSGFRAGDFIDRQECSIRHEHLLELSLQMHCGDDRRHYLICPPFRGLRTVNSNGIKSFAEDPLILINSHKSRNAWPHFFNKHP